MGDIIYRNGDLFTAPKGAVLVHSCNCQGIWGSGIAKQFAERFPEAEERYREFCKKQHPHPGSIKLIPNQDYTIACLFTSMHYGEFVDPEHMVIDATRRCISKLRLFVDGKRTFVASPKINAGKFKVPWKDTAQVIQKQWDGNWYVYCPD